MIGNDWFTPDEWQEMVRDAVEGSYRLKFTEEEMMEDSMLVKIGKHTIPVDNIIRWVDKTDHHSTLPDARILKIACDGMEDYITLHVDKVDVETFELRWKVAKLELLRIQYELSN